MGMKIFAVLTVLSAGCRTIPQADYTLNENDPQYCQTTNQNALRSNTDRRYSEMDNRQTEQQRYDSEQQSYLSAIQNELRNNALCDTTHPNQRISQGPKGDKKPNEDEKFTKEFLFNFPDSDKRIPSQPEMVGDSESGGHNAATGTLGLATDLFAIYNDPITISRERRYPKSSIALDQELKETAFMTTKKIKVDVAVGFRYQGQEFKTTRTDSANIDLRRRSFIQIQGDGQPKKLFIKDGKGELRLNLLDHNVVRYRCYAAGEIIATDYGGWNIGAKVGTIPALPIIADLKTDVSFGRYKVRKHTVMKVSHWIEYYWKDYPKDYFGPRSRDIDLHCKKFSDYVERRGLIVNSLKESQLANLVYEYDDQASRCTKDSDCRPNDTYYTARWKNRCMPGLRDRKAWECRNTGKYDTRCIAKGSLMGPGIIRECDPRPRPASEQKYTNGKHLGPLSCKPIRTKKILFGWISEDVIAKCR